MGQLSGYSDSEFRDSGGLRFFLILFGLLSKNIEQNRLLFFRSFEILDSKHKKRNLFYPDSPEKLAHMNEALPSNRIRLSVANSVLGGKSSVSIANECHLKMKLVRSLTRAAELHFQNQSNPT